ncbi:MAG: DUF2279 domain-containing protein [Chitinophagaceae bacterium]|nr:DUF2279 domain-containing protein [Chitinophagaceae bacterium]
MDKAGHVYSAYLESRTSSEMWRWTGVSRKTRIILAATSGIAYQSIIEVLDGFSSEYGFSVGDVTANILGTATFVSQELLWDQQKLKLKFSTSPKKYADPELEQRADKIFGKSFIERALKDYNRQTYWLSADIKSLTHSERWPAWLNISLGYGAEGIWGGTKNFAQDKDGNIIFDRTDIPRRRQWLISPDLNFSAIKTNKKGLRILFFVLDSFKFPAPALELTGGKLKAHLIYF